MLPRIYIILIFQIGTEGGVMENLEQKHPMPDLDSNCLIIKHTELYSILFYLH